MPSAEALRERDREDRFSEYDFLVGQVIDPETLDRAVVLAEQWNVLPHRVLIAQRWVGEEGYVAALSQYLGLPSAGHDFDRSRADPALVLLDATLGRPAEVAAAAGSHYRDGHEVMLVSSRQLDRLEPIERKAVRSEDAIGRLMRSRPALSAGTPVWLWQLLLGVIVAGLVTGSLTTAPEIAHRLVFTVLTIAFLPVTLLRAVMLAVGTWRRPRESCALVPDSELPIYSVLVPLFRESRVLPDLIRALSAIDYPAAKLDVLLILEAVDEETLPAVEAMELPGFIRVVIVPDSAPRTKPKALNYALQFARGTHVVVYDAEDEPETDQLRRAVAAFREAADTPLCLQASLNVYNTDGGWLARQFAIEYSVLFDLTLPALARLGLPVPLGGTSNHFPRDVLDRWVAWDPFNVTEDADLGIRLARSRGRIAMLPSTTWEQAPLSFAVWLPQRTRWLKGWMQTYLVHTRRPARLRRDLGLAAFLGFHAYAGGVLLSALVFPWFCLSTGVQIWNGDLLSPARSSAEYAILAVAAGNLMLTAATSLTAAVIAICRRGKPRLLLSIPLMPLHWLLISLAAYRALFQLAFAPHLWEKTEHLARTATGSKYR